MQLLISGKIDFPVASQNPGEDAQVVGDALRQARIGPGGEINLAPSRMLALQVMKQLPVIGKMGHIGRHGIDNVRLEGRLALE